jgi:hypothetical protein
MLERLVRRKCSSLLGPSVGYEKKLSVIYEYNSRSIMLEVLIKDAPLGYSPALLTNIRLGQEGLPVINSLFLASFSLTNR